MKKLQSFFKVFSSKSLIHHLKSSQILFSTFKRVTATSLYLIIFPNFFLIKVSAIIDIDAIVFIKGDAIKQGW